MKILDLLGLTELVELCKETFASITHKHSVNDITDYTVDSTFSSISTNPIQNKVVNNALVTIANDLDTIEANISKLNDEKANASDVPTKTSELTNDSGFITSSTVNTSISTHNIATDSHNDIRLLISALTTQVNNFLDVDDTTKDQLSELIALIEENADDIESITSGKVNVSDIVNDLTTNVEDKPLSAAQGVAIKVLIDELQGALDTDIANLNAHIDNMDMHVSSIERTNWNDAFDKRHEHDNASILNSTTASYTIADQTKLSEIENGANKTIVDMALSLDSDNPIANRAVQEVIQNLNDVKADESDLIEHVNDLDNPHGIMDKIIANSDVVVTEYSDEIEGDAPEISPVITAKLEEMETEISEFKIYVREVLEEVKYLIENQMYEQAVAVLDEATIGLSTLA